MADITDTCSETSPTHHYEWNTAAADFHEEVYTMADSGLDRLEASFSGR